MKFDFYQGVKDEALRMVVEAGTGLPDHVDPKDWKPMNVDEIELTAFEDDISEDVQARGFSFYKRVPPALS